MVYNNKYKTLDNEISISLPLNQELMCKYEYIRTPKNLNCYLEDYEAWVSFSTYSDEGISIEGDYQEYVIPKGGVVLLNNLVEKKSLKIVWICIRCALVLSITSIVSIILIKKKKEVKNENFEELVDNDKVDEHPIENEEKM